jgi:hypothetical protein
MLQNFSDLEDAAASKTKLWLLIGKDLAMSLMSHFFGSRLGHYVIAVVVTWILIFAIGYFFYGPTPGRPALHAFAGFRRLSQAFSPGCWPCTPRHVSMGRRKTAFRTFSGHGLTYT